MIVFKFLAAATLLGIAAAAPSESFKSTQLESRQVPADELLLTFWENGCEVEGSANARTAVFSSDSEGRSAPGDCVTADHYNWQSIQINQLNNNDWKVDVFSGEGCNNYVDTYTENGCYTAPEGQIILTARATKK